MRALRDYALRNGSNHTDLQPARRRSTRGWMHVSTGPHRIASGKVRGPASIQHSMVTRVDCWHEDESRHSNLDDEWKSPSH